MEPALRAAVEQYFATQESEDVEAYLALWASSARRPQAVSLKSIFDSGDDKFSELQITRVATTASGVRVRLRVRRERTTPPRSPEGSPVVSVSTMHWSLAYEKEGDGWKLAAEGPASDELADALIAAATDAERDAIFAEDPALINQALVTSLSRRGAAAAVRQAYKDAQRIYELSVDVARRAGSRNLEGEAVQNVANALYFQSRFPEALAAYRQRLSIERERGDDLAAAAALTGIANIHYSLAEYREALAGYRLALAIQERLEEQLGAATSLVSTGHVRYLQGDYPAAIRDYQRSRELCQALFYTDGEARALEGLGRVYLAQGDYPGALQAFAGVLEEGRARNNRGRQGLATQHMGEAHFHLGNLDTARAAFDESRQHFQAVNDLPNVGRTWQALALTDLLGGKFQLSEQEYERSMTVCAGVQDKECAARGRIGLAFAQGAQEKYREAADSYTRAVREFLAIGRREDAARAEIGLSQALAGSHDYAAAIEAAARARQAAIVIENDDVLWRALTAEARALRKMGTHDKALGVARAAASALDRLHAAVLDRPGGSVPADAAGGLATLAVAQAQVGDAAGAFRTAERLRALDLRAALAAHEREITRGMTPEERNQERAIAAEILSLSAQLGRERSLPKPDADRVRALMKSSGDAIAARREWADGLFTRLPDLALWRGLSPGANAEDLAALLDGDDALLLSAVADEDDLVWIVAWRGASGVQVAAHVVPLSRRVLADRVVALLQTATLRDAEAWRKASADVVSAMPGAVLERLAAATSVLVLPHDALWRVPFEALWIGERYLGDRAAIVYGASVRALLRSRHAPGTDAEGLLAVGAPVLPDSLRETLKQTAPGWLIRAAEGAEREAKAVAGEDGEVLIGPAATEPAVRDAASRARAIHVAAPFRINAASPLFSSVLLSGEPPGATDNGVLEAREIINLDLPARLVVLSDGAALSMRDGASSADVVQWAWLAAGVPSFAIARWTGDPAADEVLLAAFHRAVREGKAPAVALAAARAAVRTHPGFTAPFYWAGWILMGR